MTQVEDTEQKKEMSFVVFLALALGLAAIGAGAGFGAASMFAPQMEMSEGASPTESQTGDGHGSEEAHVEPGSLTVVPLAPIVTNLNIPDDTWVRAEISIATPEHLDEVALADLQSNLTAYFRTVSLDTFNSPSGFQHLVNDLEEHMQVMSDGKVKRVFVTSLVFE